MQIDDGLDVNPYKNKTYRRLIDTSAFNIYGHWVKKGEQQNRAALFETEPKRDLIQQLVSNN
jgi:phosphorylase kinase gamma subunit